jgi:hypothetical protein
MSCPDILVLIHPDHLFYLRFIGFFSDNQLTRDHLWVGQFYVIIAPLRGSVFDYHNQIHDGVNLFHSFDGPVLLNGRKERDIGKGEISFHFLESHRASKGMNLKGLWQ